jgi:hypothetical protein
MRLLGESGGPSVGKGGKSDVESRHLQGGSESCLEVEGVNRQ